MADHVCLQLRNAAIAALTGLPTTGARVGPVQRLPLAQDALPALSVSVVSDASPEGAFDVSRSVIERTPRLEVIAWAAGSADLEALLWSIAAEVEQALGATLTVAGHAVDLTYIDAELVLESGLDAPPARLTLGYSAQLWTPAADPSAFAYT
jgi:hypothetical protein